MYFGLFRQRQAACKCVQQAALRAFLIERMVGVLTVDINQLRADGFELRQRGGLVVDKAAAFAFGIDNAADGQFVAVVFQQALFAQCVGQIGLVADVEQGGQHGFFRAFADLAVIGFVAQQQGECVEGDGFACTGFAGQYGEACLEIEMEFFDNDKVLQRKCQ